MNSEFEFLSPLVVWFFTVGLLFATWYASTKDRSGTMFVATALLVAVSLGAPNGAMAFAAVAAIGALQSWSAFGESRGAAWTFGAAALACGTAAVALFYGQPSIAFGASMVATTLRIGLFPLHGGIAALCDRLSRVQLQQLATLPVLIFAHIRFASNNELATLAAIPIVAVGATSMLLFAVMSISQRTLPGLLRASTFMHGGMLLAATAAAGRGHFAAAQIVAMTMALSLTGFALVLRSFQDRVGSLEVLSAGGRARAFPRLAAALLFFGGAAVGLPGTSGFIADDLLLHALWQESVAGAVMMIVSSALLAVATFAGFARAFLGTPVRQIAPDFNARERGFAILLIGLLVLLGTLPAIVVSPVSALTRSGGLS